MPRRRLSSNTSVEKEVYSVFSKLLLVTLGPLKTVGGGMNGSSGLAATLMFSHV